MLLCSGQYPAVLLFTVISFFPELRSNSVTTFSPRSVVLYDSAQAMPGSRWSRLGRCRRGLTGKRNGKRKYLTRKTNYEAGICSTRVCSGSSNPRATFLGSRASRVWRPPGTIFTTRAVLLWQGRHRLL